MKKHILKLFLLTIVLSYSCNNQNNDDTEEVAIPVSIEEVKTKPIEQFTETSGTVYSTHEAAIRTEMAGKYYLQVNPKTKRAFMLGDVVDSGQVIIVLKDEEYENSIKIESQKLNLEITKRLYDQQKSLYDKGGVTLRELTDAERSYIDAKYAYENAKLGIEKMKIIAPFKGVIVDLPYYTPGVKLASGSLAVKLMGYHQLYFEINLPEKEMEEVKVNQKVRVFNYSYPEDTFIAKVSQLSPVIDPDTRSFKGYITVNNPKLKLRPGMFIKAEIITAYKDSAVVVPREMILSKGNRMVVYVVERSTAHERDLTLGLENPKEVEVVSGLKPDERVVVKGYETLRNRSKVKVIK